MRRLPSTDAPYHLHGGPWWEIPSAAAFEPGDVYRRYHPTPLDQVVASTEGLSIGRGGRTSFGPWDDVVGMRWGGRTPPAKDTEVFTLVAGPVEYRQALILSESPPRIALSGGPRRPGT